MDTLSHREGQSVCKHGRILGCDTCLKLTRFSELIDTFKADELSWRYKELFMMLSARKTTHNRYLLKEVVFCTVLYPEEDTTANSYGRFLLFLSCISQNWDFLKKNNYKLVLIESCFHRFSKLQLNRCLNSDASTGVCLSREKKLV